MHMSHLPPTWSCTSEEPRHRLDMGPRDVYFGIFINRRGSSGSVFVLCTCNLDVCG